MALGVGFTHWDKGHWEHGTVLLKKKEKKGKKTLTSYHQLPHHRSRSRKQKERKLEMF